MNTIRIRKTIESETLTLPELRAFIGHTVEIVIEESPPAPSGFVPGTGDWNALTRAAAALRYTYDFEAQIDQDACDRQDMRKMQERMK